MLNRAASAPGNRIGQCCTGIRIGGGSSIYRSGAILGKVCRCSRGDRRRLIDIGDGDGHGLGGAVGAIRRRNVDVIDIVAAGIARSFVVWRGLERDNTGCGIDIEQGRVSTRDRIGQRCPCIRVSGRGGIDGAAAIFGKAGRSTRSDGWSFIDVGNSDGNSLGGVLVPSERRDIDVIDIVAARIAGSFVVWRRLERDSTGHGVDVEQGRSAPEIE